MSTALIKTVVRPSNRMVAALAAIVEGRACFFVVQKRESDEAFIGRITTWVKGQGAEGIEMLPPEILPEGIELGEVLMRYRHALGLGGQPAAAAYEVDNVELVRNLKPDEI